MLHSLPVLISNDLRLVVDGHEGVALTPSEGLDLAEALARASFRRALTLEAEGCHLLAKQRTRRRQKDAA